MGIVKMFLVLICWDDLIICIIGIGGGGGGGGGVCVCVCLM
jgi:hypothetical protein